MLLLRRLQINRPQCAGEGPYLRLRVKENNKFATFVTSCTIEEKPILCVWVISCSSKFHEMYPFEFDS
jgi:hypothetical protein